MGLLNEFRTMDSDMEPVLTEDVPEHSYAWSRRHRLRHFLHSNKFQLLVISLVLVDCLVVVTELMIELEEVTN